MCMHAQERLSLETYFCNREKARHLRFQVKRFGGPGLKIFHDLDEHPAYARLLFPELRSSEHGNPWRITRIGPQADTDDGARTMRKGVQGGGMPGNTGNMDVGIQTLQIPVDQIEAQDILSAFQFVQPLDSCLQVDGRISLRIGLAPHLAHGHGSLHPKALEVPRMQRTDECALPHFDISAGVRHSSALRILLALYACGHHADQGRSRSPDFPLDLLELLIGIEDIQVAKHRLYRPDQATFR